ncbi:hypothetical protein vBBceHLY2_00155 [Bacillus phage vB_BceH_LY2]|nr:hypothetical protein vBBceHLY2_00155 [Bacillus phage vB_BceH_LY2]
MFKFLTCKHDYKVVCFKDEWTGRRYLICVYIYCPKCDRERKVNKDEWERIKIKQMIKK